VNSLPETVTRQRRDCDLNPGPSAPESSTLTTRLPSHPFSSIKLYATEKVRERKAAKEVRIMGACFSPQVFLTLLSRNAEMACRVLHSDAMK